ncbi:hypothetical protein D8674_010723 [Pyrus ussuriensis x Pyrus communis]|uniref:Uncharacterized protein n=1 Tax=Pyrus ussuriensis x Pyrus communis TaxID=2448454 RepID=A0A5N5FGT1_9ROSA|nr:hypothetical protein D8674_010723 [Pyrus ussuriensis x Pyrus communis]
MSSLFDHRLDLNVVEEVAMSPQNNIWRPSFLSPTSPLTIGDSMMKNDMTVAVVAKNLLTLKDNRLFSKRSDELAVKDSLAFSVQCLEIRELKHENKQLHMLAHNYATTMKTKLDQLQEFEGQILNDHQRFVSLFKSHLLPSSSGAVPYTEAPNDQPLVPPLSRVLPSTESPNNHPSVPPIFGALPSVETSLEQSFFVLVAIKIGFASHYLDQECCGSPSDKGSPSSSFRFELAMLESSGPLLESCAKEMLDDFRNCQTLANIGSSSFMSVGEPSFYQWRSCYKIRPVKECPAYAECACRSERERIVFGSIKLSGWELANVEKVLRVPKEDKHLGKLQPLFRKYGFQPLVAECQRLAMEKVSKKRGTSTKKGTTPMLVPVDDILFHKGARKHRVRPAPRPKSQEEVLKITASKRAEAEAISHKRKYKEEVGSIHWKDLKAAMQLSSFRYVNNCLAGRQSTVDEFGKPLNENESDRDRMMRLSSYRITSFVNGARKTSKALAEAIRLKDQHFESLKRQNGENVRLKKQLEGTGKHLETNILEVSKVKEELYSALIEVFELKRIDPSSEDDFDNEASVGEQSQESEDGFGDNEDDGDGDAVETQSDIVKGSASDEDDLYSGLGMLLARAQLGQQPLYQRQVRMEFFLLKSDMKCGMTKELGRRVYSIATLSGAVRTSPAPQLCWLDEPSTYRVHTGSVVSTFWASGGDEAMASEDVKISLCYRSFDHSPRHVRTLKYLSKGLIKAHLSVALEMNLVKATTLPVRLWMSFEVTGSFMSMIALIFSGFHDVTGEAYQRRNQVIEQVFSYIKCFESFSKHDIDRRPRVYQDSSYVKCRVVNQASALSLLGGGVEDPSCKRARPRLVPVRWSLVLGGTQVMVDFPGGDEFVCLSMRSFLEHLKELFILLLEDLILYCYLVVLSF